MLAQPPGVGVTNVIDPALYRRIKLLKFDLSGGKSCESFVQFSRCRAYLACFDETMRRIDDKPKPRDAGRTHADGTNLRHRSNSRFALGNRDRPAYPALRIHSMWDTQHNRNPTLLLRLPGWLSLRFDARALR